MNILAEVMETPWRFYSFIDVHNVEGDSYIFSRTQADWEFLEVETDVITGLTPNVRLGATYSPFPGIILKYFPGQTEMNGGKATLGWFYQRGKFGLNGILDYYTIGRFVIEPEITYALTENISAVIEGRMNDFEDSTSVAFGIRYKW